MWTSEPGVFALPSGRLVRGRGLRSRSGLVTMLRPTGSDEPVGPDPEFGVYLLESPPPTFPWPSRWVRWPDFRLPSDVGAFRDALQEAWELAPTSRVEFACGGGHGRTGTALACLAVLDGVPAASAVAYVREHYNPRAVETPWQKRFVARFTP